eukprot:11226260-Lingulodinium_polyedra.AAC.1
MAKPCRHPKGTQRKNAAGRPPGGVLKHRNDGETTFQPGTRERCVAAARNVATRCITFCGTLRRAAIRCADRSHFH